MSIAGICFAVLTLADASSAISEFAVRLGGILPAALGDTSPTPAHQESVIQDD